MNLVAASMIQCQNCGKSNTSESQFCRFCGNRMMIRQQEDYNSSAPRPYAWKTDEYQTQAEGRVRPAVNAPLQFPQQPPFPVAQPVAALAYRGPQDMTGNYRCPFCGTNYLPVMQKRISTAGWITFGILLVFTFVFFWIGLLMKEEVPVCPVCKRQVA